MRVRFWERIPLDRMSAEEWESLCDGCGKCCLLKLEDEDTGQVEFTAASCRLLDTETCRCAQYETPQKPLCQIALFLTPKTLPEHCLFSCQIPAPTVFCSKGKPLPRWHPMITGDPDSTHAAGVSVRGWAIPEFEIEEEDLEDYVLTEEYQ